MRAARVNVREIKRSVLILLGLHLVAFAIGIAFFKISEANIRFYEMCLTPWFAGRVQGTVVSVHGFTPVANAEIIIRDITPSEKGTSVCHDPVVDYPELRMTTNSEGKFIGDGSFSLRPDQRFSVTITAPNCQPFSDTGRFGTIDEHIGMLFIMACDS